MSECRDWSAGDPILEEYHDHEWCKISHDDRYQFEMLCLEDNYFDMNAGEKRIRILRGDVGPISVRSVCQIGRII